MCTERIDNLSEAKVKVPEIYSGDVWGSRDWSYKVTLGQTHLFNSSKMLIGNDGIIGDEVDAIRLMRC